MPGSRVRARVLAFAFLLAVVTYLDRICIAAAAPYIIPVRLLTERKLISVYPQKSGSRGMFEPFRNRWQLLSR